MLSTPHSAPHRASCADLVQPCRVWLFLQPEYSHDYIALPNTSKKLSKIFAASWLHSVVASCAKVLLLKDEYTLRQVSHIALLAVSGIVAYRANQKLKIQPRDLPARAL